jgi:hypothetical protein
MITGNTIRLLRELIEKVGLSEWVINLSQIEDSRQIIQIHKGIFNYIHNDLWAICYCLPTSKIAEIYLLPGYNDYEDFKKILIHELLHIKYSQGIYKLMSEIENNPTLTPEQAREEHRKLREMEHEIINLFIPTYLK